LRRWNGCWLGWVVEEGGWVGMVVWVKEKEEEVKNGDGT
jgi:hypothetical protein